MPNMEFRDKHEVIVSSSLRALADIIFMAETIDEAYQDAARPEDFSMSAVYRTAALALAIFSFFGMVMSYFSDDDRIKYSGMVSNAFMFGALAVFSEQKTAQPDRYYVLGGACGVYSLFKVVEGSWAASFYKKGQKYSNAAANGFAALALCLFAAFEGSVNAREPDVMAFGVLSIIASLSSWTFMGLGALGNENEYQSLPINNPATGLDAGLK